MKVILYTLLFRFVLSAQNDFPKDFVFGVATAAYQIEGAWNVSGKGPSLWDTVTHTQPELINNHANGDVACDSYHKYEEDIQLLVDLGVQVYRFSISWPRLLPTGFTTEVNPDGVRYYNALIDGLLANGITPFVTLYHWDHPTHLHELGGWPNPLMIDYFTMYAEIAFSLFGDRVKYWTTFNEPISFCADAYVGIQAPAYYLSGIGDYLCGHTVLKAHASVYHMYNEQFRAKQKGNIGIVLSTRWYEPKTNSTADIEATTRGQEFDIGWFANPITIGDYPQIMKDRVAQLSKEEHFPKSRLPEFTQAEIDMIRGSFDYLGINHYSSHLTSASPEGNFGPAPSRERDMSMVLEFDPSWPESSLAWLRDVPWGFRKILNYVNEKYGNPLVYVTENGFCDLDGLEDEGRIHYYKGYLENLGYAIRDGCNIKGYFAWSLMDNFEWFDGYSVRFGLYHVNFTDPTRPRTAKKSAAWYKAFIKEHRSNPGDGKTYHVTNIK